MFPQAVVLILIHSNHTLTTCSVFVLATSRACVLHPSLSQASFKMFRYD